jgi:hypothetical protein
MSVDRFSLALRPGRLMFNEVVIERNARLEVPADINQ